MSKPKDTVQTNLSLTSFFDERDILVHIEEVSRNHAIRQLLEHLAGNHGMMEIDACYNAIMEREKSGDTVISHGIAIPHGRIEKLTKPYVAIATSSKGIIFAEDKPPVHLIILVLIPRHQPGLYLQILRALASILRDRHAAGTIAQLKDSAQVMRFFERGGLVLPKYVCAGDIMVNNLMTLTMDESLESAIDSFITTRQIEIPVIDHAGAMVGIICARTLLKVCLPDYLLWMDDLSPIENFEPFVKILRHERHTRLTELLHTNYISVQIKAPAITVAAELARHNASKCYVLNGRELVGVIDLPTFLEKLLRE